MVFFNWATMQMAAKIVYYGPGLCGKTSNLSYIYAKTSPTSRGEMVSLETESDRTLFFDLLPIEVGTIGGFKTRLQLYTVPGQVFYNTTRKLVLKGVDGLVFVADSQRPMREANIESFRSLIENIEELGLEMTDLPLVLQYNKRDLQNILSEDELDSDLNPDGEYVFHPASAVNGEGVFETLKEITKLTLRKLRRRMASPQTEVSARPGTSAARPAPARPSPSEHKKTISAASLARAAEEGVVGDEAPSSYPHQTPVESPAPQQPSYTSADGDPSREIPPQPTSDEASELRTEYETIDEHTFQAEPPEIPEDSAPLALGEDGPAFDEEEADLQPEHDEQAGEGPEEDLDLTSADRFELDDDEEPAIAAYDSPSSEADVLDDGAEVLDFDDETASDLEPVDGDDGPSPDETTSPSLPAQDFEAAHDRFDDPYPAADDDLPDDLDETSSIDDDEVEFDTSADREIAAVPPLIKRVQISNQTDILAELDGLRREATEAPSSRSRHAAQMADLDLDSLLTGASTRTRDLKRRFEHSLNSNIFNKMRSVQLAFRIQDSDGSTIHTLEPISLALDDASALEKLVLQLTVDLENIK